MLARQSSPLPPVCTHQAGHHLRGRCARRRADAIHNLVDEFVRCGDCHLVHQLVLQGMGREDV